jgi:hypothetical protein
MTAAPKTSIKAEAVQKKKGDIRKLQIGDCRLPIA